MTFALGARSLAFAAHVDPKIMNVVKVALTYSLVDFGCTEDQTRTVAQQQHKFDTGVSRVRPGPSARHMIQPDGFSKAVDLVPWVDGRFQWGDGQWRIFPAQPAGAKPIFAFHEIAVAMRRASIALHVPMRWGAVWDRNLVDLPDDVPGLIQAVEAYKVRHVGSDLLDGPHFELPL